MYILPRNNEAMKKLYLTRKNVNDIILELTEANYSSGPSKDDTNPNQQIWVFGQEIDGIEIYIKLSIAKIDSVEIAKCISFHEAERPLKYPLRKK